MYKRIIPEIINVNKNDKHEYSMWFEISNRMLNILQFRLALF
jgi:hypothetical protein